MLNRDCLLRTSSIRAFASSLSLKRSQYSPINASSSLIIAIHSCGGRMFAQSIASCVASSNDKPSTSTNSVIKLVARLRSVGNPSTLLNRTDSLGIGLRSHLSTNQFLLTQVDPAQLTPGEFVHMVCDVASQGVKVIVIDSLNGFLNAMPNERLLATHLHELLIHLGQHGVVTFLIGVHQGLFTNGMSTSLDVSYLADNVILLRYFEVNGEVQQAISVFKKRVGSHERTIRQMSITPAGIRVGQVLKQFRGVLTGVPELEAGTEKESGPHD